MQNEISPNIQASLDNDPEQLIRVQGDSPEKIYYVVTDQTLRRLTDESLRQKIDAGLADLAAGRVSVFDLEDVKSRGRERLMQMKK